ncbi:MAG: glycosyltransferase, partial [Bacteroidota bacterium]|nr:glycosyltransferase [Bacteroidota bacterium]
DIPPGEVAQALSGSHVFILPSKSENFGHAIYEALSAGRPVITSTKTPWNGLRESFAGLNISIENVQAMREAVVFFASMDENQMAHWSHNSIKYAEQAIDPGQIKMQYRKMFFNE